MKLKPCPYCKTRNILIGRIHWHNLYWYFAECDVCHYCGKTKLTKLGAIIAWNREKRAKFRQYLKEE